MPGTANQIKKLNTNIPSLVEPTVASFVNKALVSKKMTAAITVVIIAAVFI